MRRVGFAVVLVLGLASVAYGQDYGCPVGMPSSPRPGASFVPTADCQGWVPGDHPLARHVEAEPIGAVPEAIMQDIYARIEYPGSVSGAITQISGWAVDCRLGVYPSTLKLIETKPDGSTREVPTWYFYDAGLSRLDVQTAFRDVCPAVLNVVQPGGNTGWSNDKFGWRVVLQSPITEPGVHVFTAQFSWPTQGHAGSSSVSVTVQ